MAVASAVSQASIATALEEEKVFGERIRRLEEEKKILQQTVEALEKDRENMKQSALASAKAEEEEEGESVRRSREDEEKEKTLWEQEEEMQRLKKEIEELGRRLEESEKEKEKAERGGGVSSKRGREQNAEGGGNWEKKEESLALVVEELEKKLAERDQEVRRLEEELGERERRERSLIEEAETQKEALSREVNILMAQVRLKTLALLVPSRFLSSRLAGFFCFFSSLSFFASSPHIRSLQNTLLPCLPTSALLYREAQGERDRQTDRASQMDRLRIRRLIDRGHVRSCSRHTAPAQRSTDWAQGPLLLALSLSVQIWICSSVPVRVVCPVSVGGYLYRVYVHI